MSETNKEQEGRAFAVELLHNYDPEVLTDWTVSPEVLIQDAIDGGCQVWEIGEGKRNTLLPPTSATDGYPLFSTVFWYGWDDRPVPTDLMTLRDEMKRIVNASTTRLSVPGMRRVDLSGKGATIAHWLDYVFRMDAARRR